MRDYETISVAMTAAETGQLVLSTLHTLGAANTIDRIWDKGDTYRAKTWHRRDPNGRGSEKTTV